eukprot:gene17359-5399_t
MNQKYFMHLVTSVDSCFMVDRPWNNPPHYQGCNTSVNCALCLLGLRAPAGSP